MRGAWRGSFAELNNEPWRSEWKSWPSASSLLTANAGLRAPPRQNIVLISAATLCARCSPIDAARECEWDSKLCVRRVSDRRRRHGVIKTATAKSSGCDTVSRGEQRSWWQYLGLSCCTNEDRTALSTHQQPRSHSSQPLCTLLHMGCCARDHYIVYSQMLLLCAKPIYIYMHKCSRRKTIKSRKCSAANLPGLWFARTNFALAPGELAWD